MAPVLVSTGAVADTCPASRAAELRLKCYTKQLASLGAYLALAYSFRLAHTLLAIPLEGNWSLADGATDTKLRKL